MAPTPSPDPSSVHTAAELAHALLELREKAGRSYQSLAGATGLSTSTVHGMCTGRSLPRPDSLRLFTKACGADPEPWLKALVRVRRGQLRRGLLRGGSGWSRGTAQPAFPGADVTIRLAPWVNIWEQKSLCHLPLRQVPGPEDAELTDISRPLAAFPLSLGPLKDSSVSVEAVAQYRGITVSVRSPEQFWALVGADIALARDGNVLWLVRQSEVLIGRNDPRQLRQLRLVWLTLFQLLLHSDAPEACDWPPRQIVEDVYHVTRARPTRAKKIMDWLLEVFPVTDIMGSRLRQAHERYVAERLPDVSHADALPFTRKLVPVGPVDVAVPGDGSGGYTFQVMRSPLTVGDMTALWPERVEKGADPRLPYVLGAWDDERGDALGRFLKALIDRCLLKSGSEPGEKWIWAVPTAAEWLALSGCAADGRPYPWGAEPAPTPRHANLSFPGRRPTVQPVERLPSGRTPAGVWDCCGNVHEVVEWRPDGLARAEPALSDLRLAGGSHRNGPANASCLTFRPFVRAPGASRRNVGLRLIRYRGEHTELRVEALRAFRASRKGAPDRRRSRGRAASPAGAGHGSVTSPPDPPC
ncbi:helix-turn-helix domain-containing protein [Streptomyces sp. NPDC052015]|uniref:helix-turn-helix domain-containing protein n=1 Tax=Streptomyces sp. NPDC052015 TaxID=3154755 RepID=UPI00342E5242